MKTVLLKRLKHSDRVGDQPPEMEPNVFEDSLFVDESSAPVGFYLRHLPEKISRLTAVADAELRSERVPKSLMRRSSNVLQFSTIIGSIPAKPHMQRSYVSRSSVHAVPSARNFVKAMNAAGKALLELMREIDPTLYRMHSNAVQSDVPERWRFSDLYTSSICNYNSAAAVHRDAGNVKRSLNSIVCKRRNSRGGHLFVPDYGLVFEQPDNSLVVYPAWQNVHGVTPIIPTHAGGYRNALIWYALSGFKGQR